MAYRSLEQGSSVRAPEQTTRYNYTKQRFEFFRAFADGYSGWLPQGSVYGSGGTVRIFSHYDRTSVTIDGRTSGAWHPVFETISLDSQSYALHDVWLQTPEEMRRRQMTPEEISNFRDQLQSINQGTCKEFLEGIRNSIPGAQNLMDVFNYMAANGGLHRQDYLRGERGQIGGYGGGNVVDGTAGVTINFTFGEDPLFTLMHETTHASGGAGSRSVSHETMARAAISAAASANINLWKYQQGPPSDLKLVVWDPKVPNADTHNSTSFPIHLAHCV